MERKPKALKLINQKKKVGIELGPLYSPIVQKEEGKIYYADHMSTSQLKKKYTGHPFDINEIVNVDYVVGNSNLSTVVKGKKFDYVIACHVIEHIPDTVSWLQDIAKVLKPGGILSLVIPDKRYSFDIHRNNSTPSEVIGAYLEKTPKATAGMVYDGVSQYSDITPMQAWSDKSGKAFKEPSHASIKVAYENAQQHIKPGGYIDCHCYAYTPYSFFNILRRLIEHDLFDYEVGYYSDTSTNELEFYVSLKKVSKHNKKKQLASLPKITRPLQTQELEKKISDLEKKIIIMETSKSWKVTQPLRKLNATGKKLKKN